MEGRSRRGLSGIVMLAFAVALIGSAGPATQSGTFALLGGMPKIDSEFSAEHIGGLNYRLKVQQFTPHHHEPILAYDIDMQKTMHMVVIRDDFATFKHLHPGFAINDGSFTAPFTKDPNHKYYVYADSIPAGKGQQVFRFTMDSDGEAMMFKLSTMPSAPAQPAGPYVVSLGKTVLAANSPQEMYIAVTRNGKPASDLTPYLGAAAHCVFINMNSLEYVHLHPLLRGEKEMDMSHNPNPNSMGEMMEMSKVGPNQQVALPALPAGTYKMWYQFKAGASQKTFLAAFTLSVQ